MREDLASSPATTEEQITLASERPWEQPIWKPARGKAGVLAFIVLIHVLAITGLILFPLPGWKVFGLSVLFMALGGIGTTVVFHRALSHRTVKLNPIIEQVMIFFTIFNGSGNPASWVAYHRLHHSHTDTPDDISSPKQGGFWWAHLRWLYQTPPADKKRWAPELTKWPYSFWEHAETPIIAVSLLFGLLLGWPGFFWMGAIRLVYALHMQCFVNSLTHLGRPKEGDSSINVWWLGPLQMTAWGENWHKNHHSFSGSARLGLRWWQTDIGWYFIWGLEAMGLAHNVKRPQTR